MNSLIVVPSRIWEYCIAAMVIILAPGPSVLFVLARAIAWGRATAVATVAGNVTGAFTLSVVVAIGLGPILQRSEIAFILVFNRLENVSILEIFEANNISHNISHHL